MFKRKHSEEKSVYLSKKRIRTLISNKTRCKFCPRVFVDKNNYIRHLKNNHEVPFNCKQCSYTTRYKLNISKHMVSHGIILKWFKCRYCDRQFKRNSARSYHEVSHTGVSCKLCSEKFYSPCSMLSHIGTQHPEKNKFHCDVCGKSFPTNVMRNSHLRNSNCRYGYRAYENEKQIFSNNVRNDKNYLFYCDLCSKGFNNENSLLAHKIMRLCRNSKISDLQFSWAKHFVTDCKLCGQKTIESRVQLKKHLLSKHIDSFYLGKPTMSEECPFCGKIIKDRIGRFMHIIQHLGFVPLKCHICDFRTSWTISLKMHLVKIHGNKCFMCHLCNKRCTNSSDYKEHLIHEHNIVQEFKYLCDDCGMGFYYLKTFRNHKIKCPSHENRVKTIKLQCEYCQKDFQDEKESHLHAANNECVDCGFIFESCLEIKQHKILFAFDRLCSFCSYIAVHGNYLSGHIKEVHPSFSLECNICSKRFSNSVTYYRHLSSHWYRKRNENFPRQSHCYKPTCDSEEEDLFSVCKLKTKRTVPKHSESIILFECCVCGIYFASANQSLEHERTHKASFNLIDESERLNKKCLLNEYYTSYVIQKVAEVKIKVTSCSLPLSKNDYSVMHPNLSRPKPGSILVSSDYNQLSKVRRRYVCEEPSDFDKNLKEQVDGHTYTNKKLTVKCKENPTPIDIKLMKITRKIKKTLMPSTILNTELTFRSKPIISNNSSLGFIKLPNPTTSTAMTISDNCDSQYRTLLENSRALLENSRALLENSRLLVESQHSSLDSKRNFNNNEQLKPMPVCKENDFQHVQVHSIKNKNCNKIIFIDKNIVPTFKEGRYNYAISDKHVNFNDMKPINLSCVDSIVSKKLKYVGMIKLPKNFSRNS